MAKYGVSFCKCNLEEFGDAAFRRVENDPLYDVEVKDCLYRCPAGRASDCRDKPFCFVDHTVYSASTADELADIIIRIKGEV